MSAAGQFEWCTNRRDWWDVRERRDVQDQDKVRWKSLESLPRPACRAFPASLARC